MDTTKPTQRFGSEITRRIWGDIDNLLLVYVGAAAEFPLVKENHWLFFTNELPARPWSRFLSTLKVNQEVFRIPEAEVTGFAQKIRDVHTRVEADRSEQEGQSREISNAAFRAVGAMLIEYGIAGREYLDRRPMSPGEKETYYQDERRFFVDMGIKDLPRSYTSFRQDWLEERWYDLVPNRRTAALMECYRQELGWWRYWILAQFMAYFVPDEIRARLGLRRNRLFAIAFKVYPYIRNPLLSFALRGILFPPHVRRGLADLSIT